MASTAEIDQWLKAQLQGGASPSKPEDVEITPQPMAEVTVTELLWNRSARPPDHQEEIEILLSLLHSLAASGPAETLRLLVQDALDACKGETAGLGLVVTDERGNKFFRNRVAVGMRSDYEGSFAPFHDVPYSVCVQRNSPQLFRHPERYFPAIEPLAPLAEFLEVPVFEGADNLGVLWIASHSGLREFDRQDVRILTILADAAAAVLRMLRLTVGQKEVEGSARLSPTS
ncbi:MAG TPA: GAF domain-containing protein [Terriglobia bacterium]|nr:GAF domain-containing protein [Terriglobia bacterium]